MLCHGNRSPCLRVPMLSFHAGPPLAVLQSASIAHSLHLSTPERFKRSREGVRATPTCFLQAAARGVSTQKGTLINTVAEVCGIPSAELWLTRGR